MNVKPLFRVLPLLLLAALPAPAQVGTTVAGASAVYTFPVGSLHDRFTGALGGMVYVGSRVSPGWTWTGKYEYVELTNLNTENLYKTVTVDQHGTSQQYQVALNKLSMSLKASGLTAEAILHLLRSSSFEGNLHFGFGFYRWEFHRDPYYDSLFVQDPGSGNPIKVAELSVPENNQSDWSGSLNGGCHLNVRVVDPVWISVGADYRLIIGELWQALDLDMESVSGLQSVSLRAGVSVRF